MGIVSAIVIGFIVGLIARFVMPGRDEAGFVLTTLLGIIGAVVGHYMGRVFGFYSANEPAGFIMSILGAALVLFLARRFARSDSVA